MILGDDEALASWSQIPVIPLSTQIRGLPWEVKLSPDDGLPSLCVLKPEWIRSVDRSFLGPWMSSFPDRRWDEVRAAVLRVLGFASA